MTAPSSRLAIDFGTSTTVAMLQRADGQVRPLLFDGSPLLSSAVLIDPDGQAHTGRDAGHLANRYPERLEPNPKRRVDDGRVLLGDREVEVRDLVAAVLRRVATEARQVASQPREVVLTHPVAWGLPRRAVLVDAAERAGLGRPHLMPEPVGAALYFERTVLADAAERAGLADAAERAGLADVSGRAGPPDADVLVYDLGAGTCDVTLLRRTPAGFHVVGSAGLDDVGGLDVDAAIVDLLRATYGDLWRDDAGRRRVWDEARAAKEMLSRSASTIVTLPERGLQVPLGRAQFDELAKPVLAPTVRLVRRLLDETGTPADRVAGLFLVGGSSRIPLAGTLLHRALGITPAITEQPELVVAEGALVPLPTAQPAHPMGRQAPDRPALGGPTVGAAARGEPTLGAPTPGGPTLGSPTAGGSTLGRPTLGGPTSGGPALGAPSPDAPALDRPALGGPAPDARALDGTALEWSALPPLPPPARRSAQRGAVAVGAVVLVVLVLCGVALNELVGGIRHNAAERRQSTASPSPAVTISTPAPYEFADVGVLCETVDFAPLRTLYTLRGRPSSDRMAADGYGSASCRVGMNGKPGGEVGMTVTMVSFQLRIFGDTAWAVEDQRATWDNAVAEKAQPTPVPNLGDQAFTYREGGVVSGPTQEMEYAVEIRAGNMRWTATLSGRSGDGTWSAATRAKIEKALLECARKSFARVAAP